MGDKTQQPFPCSWCSEPGATQVAGETGCELTPPEGAGREGVSRNTGQCRPNSLQELEEVRNTLV